MGEMKLAIGLPLTYENVPKPFFISWSIMQKQEYVFLLPTWPDNIANVRNDLVKQAMHQNCTHMIMFDTDQTFPPDTITKLVSHSLDGCRVVCGVVHRRYPPFEAMLLRGKLGKYLHVSDKLCYSGDMIKVDATGAGCIMYDLSLFDEIEKPWFEIWTGKDGKTVGEDIGFCHKLRENGVEIFVDTSIQCGHLSRFEITADFYKLYKGVTGIKMTPEEMEENQNG